ncbi:MAG: transcription termination/antitermination protein NusA [Clostridia bacterium]|nr:transcription termination/antitermination protein NusA [Clostridia bacterium]
MNKEFFEALELLEKEKGISAAYMMEKVEAALVSAYRRDSGGQENVRVKLDPVKKEVRLYRRMDVVETVEDENTQISLEDAMMKSKRYKVGDVYEIELKPKNFGRISAQTGKQVIIQGIREAERGMMIKEYDEKKEEIVSAIVTRVDPTTGNATLEIGKNEMALYKHEQIADENLQVGDRIKVFITEIRRESRGPSIVLSRVHPGLVTRLFELEVPEVKDGTVVINAVAREAGSRTKIAVSSTNPEVDPIGSCIGPKGARKNAISAELVGEKIDIIKYSEDPAEFISAALAPATVLSVVKTADGDNSYRVLVSDDQLSLAIGRKGQNARLAAKLTGCKIDIKSNRAAEAELAEGVEEEQN